MKGVDKNAFFLKELADATKIRSRIMDLCVRTCT
jgi:NADH dehydrogenase FAD-containing subunit